MIVVSVNLDSAISPTRDKELARVHISNIGGDSVHGDYLVQSFRGRSTEQLNAGVVQRSANVNRHPREREHVLNLVAKALIAMGYGK